MVKEILESSLSETLQIDFILLLFDNYVFTMVKEIYAVLSIVCILSIVCKIEVYIAVIGQFASKKWCTEFHTPPKI